MELKQVIESAAKPKISIIMQSYLGNYPGSRKDSQSKFLRAVKSFQNQLYKNCELIIVADDCMETKALYDVHFKHEDSIRLILVSRQAKEMSTYMKNEEGHKYYRGFPRRVGVGAATGDLITYMDSDDMLLEEHTLHLMIEYNKNPQANWWINRAWYDHEVMKFKDDNTFEDSQEYGEELPDLEERWNVSRIKEGLVVMSPWLFMHLPSPSIHWRDTWGNVSEDSDFNVRFRKQHKGGAIMNRPTYVRCHFTDKWDV